MPTNPTRQFQSPHTAAVHAGTTFPKTGHGISEPIVHTAPFTYTDTADLRNVMTHRVQKKQIDRRGYARQGNPTVLSVADRIAALEGSEAAVLTQSGMKAISAVMLTFLSAGDRLVLTSNLYRHTYNVAQKLLEKFGVETVIVPFGDYDALEAAITPNTKMLFSEALTNPNVRVLDLEKFAALGQKHQVLTVVDATLATPLNVRPIAYGIDIVVHSASKYFSGHNDILAGAIACRYELWQPLMDLLNWTGGLLDPNSAFLLARGLKTLAVRVQHQNETCRQLAQWLEDHPRVTKVWHPDLESHPEHDLAQRTLSGCGGLFSFELEGDLADGEAVLDKMQLAIIGPSLGGAECLVSHPSVTTWWDKTAAERAAAGIKDNLIRVSVGLESVEDLIADFAQALG